MHAGIFDRIYAIWNCTVGSLRALPVEVCRAASVFRAHVVVVCTTMTRVECFHSKVVEVVISETTGRVLLNNAAMPETFHFNHAQAIRDLLAPESTLILALD